MKNILIVLIMYYLSCIHLAAQTPELKLQMPVKIDFQSYSGSGFAPLEGQGRLDSRAWRVTGLSDGNMEFSGTYLGGDYGRGISPGKVSSGGVYAFQVNTNTRILGFQATGTDLIPGTLTLKINVSDLDKADRIEIAYNAYVMNDQNRSTAIKFEWSIDDKKYTQINDLSFNTPIASEAQASWQSMTREGMIPVSNLETMDHLYLRWHMNDAGGSGSRDEWGLSNIQIQLIPSDQKDEDDNSDGGTLPTIPATDIKLENRNDTTMTVHWKNGSGTSRLVLVKPMPNTQCKPLNSVSYSSNVNPALADTTQGSCSIVFNGKGNTFQLKGLRANQDIHLVIIEYNGDVGSERYQTEIVAAASFRTRSAPPQPQESLKIVHITDEAVYINWDDPGTSDVRIVLANKIPTGDQLLAFEKDAYQSIDSTGFKKVCLSSKPCVLQRTEIAENKIYAWNVAGEMGHRSAQIQAPLHIQPEWPSAELGAILVKWSFDNDTDEKSQSIWDFEDANFLIHGARDRGYAPGNIGRARYSDQWDESNGSKSWKVKLSTWGFEEMSVSFKIISSNTGPADFQLICGNTDQFTRDSRILKAGSAWNTTKLYTVFLPKQCMGQTEVDVHIAAIGLTALNGNPVSRSGTSRLDDLTFRGKRAPDAGMLLSSPAVIMITDDSTLLATHLISTGGDYPIRRYLKLWNGTLISVIELNTYGSKVQNVRLPNLALNTAYSAEHCVWTIQNKTCSKATLFRTPYAIPEPPYLTSVNATHLDSISVEYSRSQSDLWVFVTDDKTIEPQLKDSVGLKNTLDGSSTYIRRFSQIDRAVIGGLRPGREYYVWMVSVVGPDSVMRFSRPPYSNHRVSLPKLPSPRNHSLQLDILQLGTDLIRFEILDSIHSKVLWTIGPDQIPGSPPLDDKNYRADNKFGHGDSISLGIYVIAKGNQSEFTLKNLPLSRSWVIRGYAYNELNGAISYLGEPLVAFPFKSLRDPREYAIKVPEITRVKDKEEFGLLGTVAWIDSDKMVLLGEGGNVIIHHKDIKPKLGDSLAVLVSIDQEKISLRYSHHLGLSKKGIQEPFLVDSKKKDLDYRTQTYLGFGNLLVTDIRCPNNGRLFVQRGSTRRPICVLNLENLDLSLKKVSEMALRGIPLWTTSDTLHVWMMNPDDLVPYIPGKVFTSLPNTGQLITWKQGSSEEISFSLVRRPAQRLYDAWPDSSEWKTYLATRIAGSGNRFILRTELDLLEMSFPAAELHRMHLGLDTLASHIDIEWTVWNQEGRISEAREEDLLWQPFQLLRVEATHLRDSLDVPNRFELSPPWPNPFNPSTHFRLSLPSSHHVKVNVYDILGRRVASIVDANMLAGNHEITWNARGLSSGTYLLKVQYQDKILVRRMTLFN